MLREGGNAVDAAVAAVLTSFVTESPLTGLGAGGYMLVHTGDETDRARLLRRRAGRRRARARAPSWSRSRSTSPPESAAGLPRRRRLLRRARARRPGSSGRCERFGTVPLAELAAPAARARPRGRRGQRRAGLLHRDPGADPDPLRGGARDLRAGRQAARARATVPLPRARRRARAARRRGLGAVLPRRDRAPRSPTGCSSAAARSAPADLAAYEPIAREPVARDASAAARCSPTRRRRRAGS